ncbi:MAG TPA: MFS transporter [Mycobacteriales bacterium]|nr:MFS transporter [Mycobacteriales bacterium]
MIRVPNGVVRLTRGRRFRQLLSTRMLGQVGDGVFQVSLASFVLFSPERQTSAAQIAAGFATLLLPYSLVGPFAGVFIDRWRRQRILGFANALRIVLLFAVAALVAAGVEGPLFYAAALSVIGVNRFFLSALSASLPHVVAEDELVTANSVSVTLGSVATVLGAGTGLLIRQVAGSDDRGAATIALAATVAYFASAVAAARMPSRLLGPDVTVAHAPLRHALGEVTRGITAGARYVWRHRAAGLALAAIGSHRFFYGISTIATLLLYRNYAGFTDRGWVRDDLAGLGQIIAAGSIGALLAAVVTPGGTRRLGKQRWIVACFTLAAVVEAVLAPTYRQEIFLVAALLLGFAAQGSKICVDTIVQETVDDEFRGRVFAFYDIVFNVSFVSAAGLSALLLPDDGRSYAVLALITVGYAATAFVYGRSAPAQPAPDDAPAGLPVAAEPRVAGGPHLS